MRYKVGDKVRVQSITAYDNVKIGEVGTVLQVTNNLRYAVEFEEYGGGKHNCNGLCRDGYGWFCVESMLEPVDAKGDVCTGFRKGKISTREAFQKEYECEWVIPVGDTRIDKTDSIKDNIDALVSSYSALLPKGVSVHDLDYSSLYRAQPITIQIDKAEDFDKAEFARRLDDYFKRLSVRSSRATNIYFDESIFKEDKPMKFTFSTTEGYRIDKSNNTKIPTITTKVEDTWGNSAAVTCDKDNFDQRQGVLEAVAQLYCKGSFDKEYKKAIKLNEIDDKSKRTCKYCGQVFDTVEEREAHEAWHVECRKARHERYKLRKRAKEIAFEEAAKKMAEEMSK